MQDDTIKDIARNVLKDVVEDNQDSEARDMFVALVDMLKMSEDEWMKERKRQDREKVERFEREYLQRKTLEQQMNEILSI